MIVLVALIVIHVLYAPQIISTKMKNVQNVSLIARIALAQPIATFANQENIPFKEGVLLV